MRAGEWLTVALLAAVVAAVIWGRRKGGQKLAAALSEARAAGYADAEAAAAARADARATGGTVVVNGLGIGGSAPVVEDHDAAAAAARVVRAELLGMDAVQRRRFLDSIGVGDLFPGVEYGRDASDHDGAAVRAGGVHRGELLPPGFSPVVPRDR